MFKDLKTGIIYSCRKDAVVMMGTSRYKRALAKRQFEFGYTPKEGEQVLKINY